MRRLSVVDTVLQRQHEKPGEGYGPGEPRWVLLDRIFNPVRTTFGSQERDFDTYNPSNTAAETIWDAEAHREWERLNSLFDIAQDPGLDNVERMEEELLDEGLGLNNLRLADNDPDVTEEDLLGEEDE